MFTTPFTYMAASAVGFDPDAQAFFDAIVTAGGSLTTPQEDAVNDLVVGLKNYSLWTKMQVIYPFVGGTSTTHKFNLKDPRDLDAAFRITFNGGFTQDSNGITANGTNGYADTFYTPSTSGSQNDQHISVYSRTNNTRDCKDLGTLTAGSNQLTLDLRSTANEFTSGVNSSDDVSSGLFGTSAGLFLSSRTTSTEFKIFRNGTLAKTPSVASAGRSTVKTYLSALNNNGTAQQFSNRNLAWASIGLGLSDTEAANLYTVVQAYETALSRQV